MKKIGSFTWYDRSKQLSLLSLFFGHALQLADFPVGLDSKESFCSRRPSSIPGLGRSAGEGNGSSILAWKIPWTEQPGGLQSIG